MVNGNGMLNGLLSGLNPAVARILDRALEEREITVEEAEILFGLTGRELFGLMLVADELRRRAVGEIVTYVTVRNINFTNICYTGCRFCAFAKHLGDTDAEWMSLDEVADRAEEAWRAGATEVCMQGGLHPKMEGNHYRELILAIKARAPEMHIHAFSPFEIQYGAQRSGLSHADFLKMLKDAGLGSIPGTAAEILDSEIRQRLTKNKLSAEQWVEIVTTAHRLGIRSTSTIMYGHIDTPRQWAAHLALLRDIQRDTGGFTEFVPLGFIHHNAPIYLDGESRPGPTGLEDLRMHAVARIMLHNFIPNIQVSWVKLGPKFAQMCLNAGANDFGGTLMNETISRSAGSSYGEYMPPEEFQRLIWDLGRIPAQRSTAYKLLKVFDPALS
ncbi:MAG: 5-amino-6-(D-ribitylamino)uracil--L-tyrosine 4-hydroxyphenyl transferase CofH [Chloroflexi bacterium]|nr:5-amino-6-(D-ribitylamino)uracil--L-tyrosine 4-hydroxyphenyl transferase CofH [Chloroflexota bacterium]MCL5274561.1 5-amino-6-(D-ribitylamino)uracil--L-tyrosine 4-hydroxyphenyl transferase CofH [Chloroflexota bacterium]